MFTANSFSVLLIPVDVSTGAAVGEEIGLIVTSIEKKLLQCYKFINCWQY